jgi:hypothetical protein
MCQYFEIVFIQLLLYIVHGIRKTQNNATSNLIKSKKYLKTNIISTDGSRRNPSTLFHFSFKLETPYKRRINLNLYWKHRHKDNLTRNKLFLKMLKKVLYWQPKHEILRNLAEFYSEKFISQKCVVNDGFLCSLILLVDPGYKTWPY